MANPPDGPSFPGATGPIVAATVVSMGAAVDWMRDDLAANMPKYNKIRDCIAGEEAVKSKGDVYLPRPNASDISPENRARYDGYVVRALFYAVTEHTLSGMLGQVFVIDPVIDVPTLLDAVVKDANGSGVPLVQLAKETEAKVLAYGRSGILVDMPVATGMVSLADQQSGKIRPTITAYEPWNVINWRTITRGGEIILSLVVIAEKWEKTDDGFSVTCEDQYRVLRLVNDVYQQEIWRGTTGNWAIEGGVIFPLDSKGARLDEIPFTFVGSVDNSPNIDPPPMYAMANINIAHYRNSADYEESVYMTGQATPVLSGLTQQWVDDVLKGEVRLGSHSAIPLPVGGSAVLLEMSERTAAFEAMEHKEKQMVALGARLVESKTVQRTATESKGDKSTQDSTLTTVTKNVSAAFKWALEWAAIFAGATTIADDASGDEKEGAIKFELNTEFDIVNVGPEDAKASIDAWQKDAITFEEMRTTVKKAGMASEDDVKAMAKITEARMADAQFVMENEVIPTANANNLPDPNLPPGNKPPAKQ